MIQAKGTWNKLHHFDQVKLYALDDHAILQHQSMLHNIVQATQLRML